MRPIRFSEALHEAGVRATWEASGDPFVLGVTADSRRVERGSLFVCMPSASRDTHDFIPEVAEKGAVGVVVRSPEAFAQAVVLGLAAVGLVDEGQAFNAAVGRLCRELFDDPSGEMRVVGVTGTNGKTTVAWMVRNALVALGEPSAYLGTVGFQTGDERRTLENTTPFPVELWNLLDEAREAGCENVVMETSSHALYERRLAGVSFDVGVFTNLSQDHLDFHGTMEAYEAAKKLLFTEYAAASVGGFAAAINVGDPVGRRWLPDLACPVYSFGSQEAMVRATGSDVRVDGLTLTLAGGASHRLRFGGLYNVENATAALAALVAMGFDARDALEALAGCPPVPGRFEAVPNDRGIGIIVDYAHTPDALSLLLRSVRELNPARIIAVFGCGGDRDRTKRPKMAAAVSEAADLTIVTSDNPRTEDPETIIAEIVTGIRKGADWEKVTDRREAVARAIALAQPSDVVVIAGKGHEDYQIIGREKTHMDDRELARDGLARLGGGS
jgi:UDP-N-acetylmuramoyl-L-alanyl-D-glutamate--2,6-diaminopimelate ligase